MKRVNLQAATREESGKGPSRRFRRQGLLPAVVYGGHTEPMSVIVQSADFSKSVTGDRGSNVIVNLEVQGKGEASTKVTMIRELQTDPLTQQPLHVDFQIIDLEKQVEVLVPLELIGKPEGVKSGGVLQQIERELQVRCLPLEIPDRISVDVSNLGMGDSLHVSDIVVPEGTQILTSGEHTIAIVAGIAEEAPKAEGEEEGEEAGEAGKAEE
ncbi:MAG TPA: 50S ribosomal protein L25 [Thermodesulfobacteriota bacterium]|nr:50S ribosomal protein L25 [Deltaproteobacteria bacterium]HNR11885.1 50S ribosomal protein L25 [Thermodesulfobacteriota bacterium]HNU70148.1 50S ribosomal protein L25 [Thermodesulfobacteriota bacterium]HQO77667.1 50S ribosomal protein L25 [Thermodesulfobacteriota bacterium]